MKAIILPMGPGRHAAKMGLILGGYLSLIHMMWMYSPSIPILWLPYLLGLLFTPVVAYFLGRRFRDFFPEEAPYPFVIAWAHGVQMFLFAGIILLLPNYFYFTSALPQQIPAMEQMLEQVYRNTPEAKPLLHQVYGGNPIDLFYAVTSRDKLWGNLWSGFSMTVFLGSIISVVNALILRRSARTSTTNNQRSA